MFCALFLIYVFLMFSIEAMWLKTPKPNNNILPGPQGLGNALTLYRAG